MESRKLSKDILWAMSETVRSLSETERMNEASVVQLLPRKARERPDRLLRQLTPHAAEKRQQCALIFRLERLAAEQRETVDIVGGEQADELILRLARKGLAVAEVPRLEL